MALDNIATLVLAHIRDEEVGSNGASRIFARANNRKELLRRICRFLAHSCPGRVRRQVRS
jgi:hypothetical protein